MSVIFKEEPQSLSLEASLTTQNKNNRIQWESGAKPKTERRSWMKHVKILQKKRVLPPTLLKYIGKLHSTGQCEAKKISLNKSGVSNTKPAFEQNKIDSNLSDINVRIEEPAVKKTVEKTVEKTVHRSHLLVSDVTAQIKRNPDIAPLDVHSTRRRQRPTEKNVKDASSDKNPELFKKPPVVENPYRKIYDFNGNNNRQSGKHNKVVPQEISDKIIDIKGKDINLNTRKALDILKPDSDMLRIMNESKSETFSKPFSQQVSPKFNPLRRLNAARNKANLIIDHKRVPKLKESNGRSKISSADSYEDNPILIDMESSQDDNSPLQLSDNWHYPADETDCINTSSNEDKTTQNREQKVLKNLEKFVKKCKVVLSPLQENMSSFDKFSMNYNEKAIAGNDRNVKRKSQNLIVGNTAKKQRTNNIDTHNAQISEDNLHSVGMTNLTDREIMSLAYEESESQEHELQSKNSDSDVQFPFDQSNTQPEISKNKEMCVLNKDKLNNNMDTFDKNVSSGKDSNTVVTDINQNRKRNSRNAEKCKQQSDKTVELNRKQTDSFDNLNSGKSVVVNKRDINQNSNTKSIDVNERSQKSVTFQSPLVTIGQQREQLLIKTLESEKPTLNDIYCEISFDESGLDVSQDKTAEEAYAKALKALLEHNPTESAFRSPRKNECVSSEYDFSEELFSNSESQFDKMFREGTASSNNSSNSSKFNEYNSGRITPKKSFSSRYLPKKNDLRKTTPTNEELVEDNEGSGSNYRYKIKSNEVSVSMANLLKAASQKTAVKKSDSPLPWSLVANSQDDKKDHMRIFQSRNNQINEEEIRKALNIQGNVKFVVQVVNGSQLGNLTAKTPIDKMFEKDVNETGKNISGNSTVPLTINSASLEIGHTKSVDKTNVGKEDMLSNQDPKEKSSKQKALTSLLQANSTMEYELEEDDNQNFKKVYHNKNKGINQVHVNENSNGSVNSVSDDAIMEGFISLSNDGLADDDDDFVVDRNDNENSNSSMGEVQSKHYDLKKMLQQSTYEDDKCATENDKYATENDNVDNADRNSDRSSPSEEFNIAKDMQCSEFLFLSPPKKKMLKRFLKPSTEDDDFSSNIAVAHMENVTKLNLNEIEKAVSTSPNPSQDEDIFSVNGDDIDSDNETEGMETVSGNDNSSYLAARNNENEINPESENLKIVNDKIDSLHNVVAISQVSTFDPTEAKSNSNVENVPLIEDPDEYGQICNSNSTNSNIIDDQDYVEKENKLDFDGNIFSSQLCEENLSQQATSLIRSDSELTVQNGTVNEKYSQLFGGDDPSIDRLTPITSIIKDKFPGIPKSLTSSETAPVVEENRLGVSSKDTSPGVGYEDNYLALHFPNTENIPNNFYQNSDEVENNIFTTERVSDYITSEHVFAEVRTQLSEIMTDECEETTQEIEKLENEIKSRRGLIVVLQEQVNTQSMKMDKLTEVKQKQIYKIQCQLKEAEEELQKYPWKIVTERANDLEETIEQKAKELKTLEKKILSAKGSLGYYLSEEGIKKLTKQNEGLEKAIKQNRAKLDALKYCIEEVEINPRHTKGVNVKGYNSNQLMYTNICELLDKCYLPQSIARRANNPTSRVMINDKENSDRKVRTLESKKVLEYIHGGKDAALYGAVDYLVQFGTVDVMRDLAILYKKAKEDRQDLMEEGQQQNQSKDFNLEGFIFDRKRKYNQFLTKRKYKYLCKIQSAVLNATENDEVKPIPKIINILREGSSVNFSNIENSIDSINKGLGPVFQIPKVLGTSRTLTGLVLMITNSLTRVAHLEQQLVWLDDLPNHFIFQFADEGGPEEKQLQLAMSIGILTCWNLGTRRHSPEHQYMMHGFTVPEKERTALMTDIWRQHTDEMLIMEGCVFTVQGKKCTFSFEPSADMSWHNWAANDTSQLTQFPSVYADVTSENLAIPSGQVGVEAGSAWKPFTYNERIQNARGLQGFLKDLDKNMPTAERLMRRKEYMISAGVRQIGPPRIGQLVERLRPEPSQCEISVITNLMMMLINEFLKRKRLAVLASVLSADTPQGQTTAGSNDRYASTYGSKKCIPLKPGTVGCGLPHIGRLVYVHYSSAVKEEKNNLKLSLNSSDVTMMLQHWHLLVDALGYAKETEHEKITRLAYGKIGEYIREAMDLIYSTQINSAGVERCNHLLKMVYNCILFFFGKRNVTTGVWTLCQALPYHMNKLYEQYKTGYGIVYGHPDSSTVNSVKQDLKEVKEVQSSKLGRGRWWQCSRINYIRTFYLTEHEYLPYPTEAYNPRTPVPDSSQICTCGRKKKRDTEGELQCVVCEDRLIMPLIQVVITGKANHELKEFLDLIEREDLEKRKSA